MDNRAIATIVLLFAGVALAAPAGPGAAERSPVPRACPR